KSDGKHSGRDHVVFVQPAQLGKSGKVADVVEARGVVLIRDDPAHVGPEEAEQCGRVQVVFLVGIAVVMAMMSSPPKNALLRGSHSHESDEELERKTGLKGAV